MNVLIITNVKFVQMKKIKYLLVFVLFFSVASYSNAMGWFFDGGNNCGGNKGGGGGHGTPVGAPLDGGLLTILGAAGVTYFLVRKKKQRNLNE